MKITDETSKLLGDLGRCINIGELADAEERTMRDTKLKAGMFLRGFCGGAFGHYYGDKLVAQSTEKPKVGQRVKCGQSDAGSRGTVTEGPADKLPVQWDHGSALFAERARLHPLRLWMIQIFPDDSGGPTPKSCSSCQYPNEYNHPANHATGWQCSSCRLWTKLA